MTVNKLAQGTLCEIGRAENDEGVESSRCELQKCGSTALVLQHKLNTLHLVSEQVYRTMRNGDKGGESPTIIQ